MCQFLADVYLNLSYADSPTGVFCCIPDQFSSTVASLLNEIVGVIFWIEYLVCLFDKAHWHFRPIEVFADFSQKVKDFLFQVQSFQLSIAEGAQSFWPFVFN